MRNRRVSDFPYQNQASGLQETLISLLRVSCVLSMTLCWVCSSSAVVTVPEKTTEELPLSSNFRYLSPESSECSVWARACCRGCSAHGCQRAEEKGQGRSFPCPPPETYIFQQTLPSLLSPPSEAILKIHQGIDPFIRSESS